MAAAGRARRRPRRRCTCTSRCTSPSADYDAAVALLRERGEDVEEIAFDGAGRAAYVTDPDGNVVELWTWDVAEHLR